MDRWQDKHTQKKDKKRRLREEAEWRKKNGPVTTRIDPSIKKSKE